MAVADAGQGAAGDRDRHLSEVHLCSTMDDDKDASAFVFVASNEVNGIADGDEENGYALVAPSRWYHDSDGDLVLPRRPPKRRRVHQQNQRGLCGTSGGVIRIRHALATPLQDVGLQVWRGALLLSDWLLAPANHHSVRGATCIDLGAGCALTSLTAAAAGAKTIFCTDHQVSVLVNAVENVGANLGPIGMDADVRVRRLEWDQWASLPQVGVADNSRGDTSNCVIEGDPAEPFGWTSADELEISRASLLLAADCCYDDDATDELLRCVAGLLGRMANGARAIFALERRVCFCVEGLRARAPAAEHFEASLWARVDSGEWTAEPLRLGDFPQRFEGYDRGKAVLDLWSVQRASPSPHVSPNKSPGASLSQSMSDMR
jgi:predicted nicotinamide N-methyase